MKQTIFDGKGEDLFIKLAGYYVEKIIIKNCNRVNIIVNDYCTITDKFKDSILFINCKNIMVEGSNKLFLKGNLGIIGNTDYVLLSSIISEGAEIGIQANRKEDVHKKFIINKCNISNSKNEGIYLGEARPTIIKFDIIKIIDTVIVNCRKDGLQLAAANFADIDKCVIQHNAKGKIFGQDFDIMINPLVLDCRIQNSSIGKLFSHKSSQTRIQ